MFNEKNTKMKLLKVIDYVLIVLNRKIIKPIPQIELLWEIIIKSAIRHLLLFWPTIFISNIPRLTSLFIFNSELSFIK